jgi:hypothetical protein
MSKFDPGTVLDAILLVTLGGALLAVPWFGYGPLATVLLGFMLGITTTEGFARLTR